MRVWKRGLEGSGLSEDELGGGRSGLNERVSMSAIKRAMWTL